MVRVVYQLRRGPLGLGIDVNGRNEVVKLMPNGQAAVDGLGLVGDVVEAVDGRLLQGCRLQDVMVPGQHVYELVVKRSSVPLEAAVARSFSPVPLLRCLELQVKAGPKGLGIDIEHVSSIRGLIPGGMAEQERVLLSGDLIIAVDRVTVGPQGLKPIIAPGQNLYRFMVLRPEVLVPPSTAVTGADSFVAAIEQLAIESKEATSRARAAAAEADRVYVSRAAAAAARQVGAPAEGSSRSSTQADLEGAARALDVTTINRQDGFAPSVSLVIEQASAATQGQMAGQRLDADPSNGRITAEAEPVTVTAQSLATRPRHLDAAELKCLQQDESVGSGSSERHLAIERAAQLKKLPAQLAAAKLEKLTASDAAEAEAATAVREQAESFPGGMPHGGEAVLGGKEEPRSLTTPTPAPCATSTNASSFVWSAAASVARGFLWGTNVASLATRQEPHELTSSCPQQVQPFIAAKSMLAHNPMPPDVGESSKDGRDGAEEGQIEGGGLAPPVPMKTSEPRSAAQLAVLWDIETCPLPLETGFSVSRRLEDIAGWRARIGPVTVYESTGDAYAAGRDLACGSTVKHGADSADRVGAMLTDLLMHTLDHPGTAILLITNQRSVLTAAVQLAARGFGVSVALPDGFDSGCLPSSERITLLRGLYCWPQLSPYTRSTRRVAVEDAEVTTTGKKAEHQDGPASRAVGSLAVVQEQKTASASNDAQATFATTVPYASFYTATHNSIALRISNVSTPMASAAASHCHSASDSTPLTDAEAVGSEDPIAKMIRQAQSLGDDALVAKLQAIGS